MTTTLPVDITKNIMWPTCIFTAQWPKHREYAIDLQKNIDSWADEKSEGGISRAVKKNLYESTFDFLQQDEECVSALEQFALYTLSEICKDLNQNTWKKNDAFQIEIVESWFHITKNNGYHDVHSHPMSSWSGIYYLDIGDSTVVTSSGINRFYAPFKTDYLDRGNEFLTNIWDLEPKNGMLVLFPSYLNHSALPYSGKTPRYVIAFNARVNNAS
jgi:uncharacterized protein (TIGR02466 family)